MDRSTKVILALIAGGLWVNAIGSLARPARAEGDTDIWLGRIAPEVASIASDLHSLATGGPTCSNEKLCN